MISKHIRHYLTEEGKQIFPRFLEKLKRVRPEVLGFVDILVGQEKGDTEATHLILVFADKQGLQNWLDNPIHMTLLTELQPYLYKESEIRHFELTSVK